MEIKNDNYITIPAIARLEHDLKGNDLLVYGIIHGFTQHRGWCDCGLQYICDWIGCADKSRVSIIISRLVELGVIEKQDVYVNNVKFCKYRAITQHRSEKHNGGIVESTTNNIKDNILPLDIDKPISSPRGTKKVFVRPTLEEVSAYCKQRNNGIDAQYFLDYQDARGWKMNGKTPIKDWQAAVRTFERFNKRDTRPFDVRKAAFFQSLKDLLDKEEFRGCNSYVQSFYEYWVQKTDDERMLWEKQPAFEIERRVREYILNHKR